MLHVDVDYEDGMGQGMFDLETVLSKFLHQTLPDHHLILPGLNPPEIWLSFEKNQRTKTAHLV